MDALKQPDIPIYFDTSALWREQVIAALRERFPDRALCVPTIAHFERVRQLYHDLGDGFDEGVIQDFIETYVLTLVDLTQKAADLVAQMACRMEEQNLPWKPQWPEERRNVEEHPCGQRCRLGDYAIAATAKIDDGLLLTADGELLDTCGDHPDLFPRAISSNEMREFLDTLPPR